MVTPSIDLTDSWHKVDRQKIADDDKPPQRRRARTRCLAGGRNPAIRRNQALNIHRQPASLYHRLKKFNTWLQCD
jgi:hypothetical protein